MQYFFILGSNPTLSLAELSAVFSYEDKLSLIQTNIAILETNREISPNIINKIGGTVKFGLIYDEINSHSTSGILNAVTNFAKPDSSEKKFMFGISNYGKSKTNIKALAMEFKKMLKQSGINSRWVISREPTLSSVVVEQNKLTSDRGVEIVIIEFNNKLLLGKTLAVQPFKELSFRDYGRPARDDRSGMLPPKLAQIMINLAVAPSLYPPCKGPSRLGLAEAEGLGGLNSLDEKNIKERGEKIILDPFCGSGTILTEAMLMGYEHIIGSDISNKAIENTKINIEWTKKNFQFSPIRGQAIFNFQLLKADATQISEHIAPNFVDAIITEPYLGPQRGWFDINKTVSDLENLYTKSLSEFKKILKPGGRIVIVWPSFYSKRKNIFLNPNLAGLKIINPIPENLRTNIFVKLTGRDTIIYGRELQKVWREIVVMEREVQT